jgi:succinyl-diaminopimelate desuccinylase
MATAAQSITDTLTELLSHLVRFPTVSADHATNRAALDWVEQQLEGLPLQVKHLENHGVPALVATTASVKNPKNPKLWLAAHIDVVAGHPLEFSPVVRDGRLYGRGAHDMKFALATFIALLQELGPNLATYDLGLMVTADEEVGGKNGTRWLVEDLGYRGEAVLIPDCSRVWSMETGAKGINWWEITSTGVATHASRPWEGVNAIDKLNRFIEHVRTHFPTEPCGDPKHAHNTLNYSSITAGSSTNLVPDSATAKVDIRFTPDTDAAIIAGWFKEAEAAVPSVTAQPLAADNPYHVKGNGADKLFKEIASEAIGKEIPDFIAHGSSDARFFSAKGVPTINIGPTGSGFHVQNEWVDVTDLTLYYQVVRRFVENWLK